MYKLCISDNYKFVHLGEYTKKEIVSLINAYEVKEKLIYYDFYDDINSVLIVYNNHWGE